MYSLFIMVFQHVLLVFFYVLSYDVKVYFFAVEENFARSELGDRVYRVVILRNSVENFIHCVAFCLEIEFAISKIVECIRSTWPLVVEWFTGVKI